MEELFKADQIPAKVWRCLSEEGVGSWRELWKARDSLVSEEQFGFMPGRGITDTIFALKQLMERYREMQTEQHKVFIDQEKVYERVPTHKVCRCMRVKEIPEKYVRLVKEMYKRAMTQVKSNVGVTEGFTVRVGLQIE
ncbi:uncharacterized protein LOC111626514 [Centruroides sculpturatus]|uniref:uncharacterized protein LOC111626514 n=1 Tax=Centruroides sculpturatus TaxID=218467 RepID=UPI000C6E6B0C|nr:uncharacterized protein LOC111626514 [Centruroides sculpturatus]